MADKVRCYICGTEFDRDKTDECPYCDWYYEGWEDGWDENEYVSSNHTTIAKAKANLAKGLDIWGDPLPKN